MNEALSVQVFHICDNGRKISFLCPNGTIFQQSQLICDWWFKVDCSKSTELYEQSSEQLFEEERRRAETSRKKSKFDYQQSIEQQDRGQQDDYYDVQNLSYDGKQNGRIKPYEEPPQDNQLQSNRERIKSSRHFDSGNNFSRESNAQRDNDQLFGVNGFQSSNQPPNLKQQFDQFTRNTEEGNVNRYSTTNQDYYTASKKTQNYYVTNRNSNAQRDDKGSTLKRLKFKGLSGRNNSTSTTASQRVTPAYTESTTFRGGNTSPVKESQQFAESAAFVGNRGNRFNENTGNTHHYYYQLYINRGDSTTRNPNYDPTTSTIRDNENDVSTRRNDYSHSYYETTTQYPTPTATTTPYNDEIATESSLSTNSFANFDTRPTESLRFANTNYEYRGHQKVRGSNVRSSFVDKNHHNINDNRESNRVANVGTIPPTARSYVATDAYRQNTVTPSSPQQRYTTTGHYQSPTSTASFRSNNFARGTERPVNTIDSRSNGLNGDTKPSGKNPSTVSPGYRQNFISTSTEKPYKTTAIYQENTEKDLSPYDRSFTYKQGKVMSTLGPYVPFTRNYAYTWATSTSRPTLYTPTVPTYTTAYPSPKASTPKSKHPTSTSGSKTNGSRSSEREHVLSMLHSLKNLEHSVPGLSDAFKGGERATNVSVPPDPSTLHSLALYFSTATENFNSNETTDSSVNVASVDTLSKKSNGTVQVPTSLLTRHTIDSYTELFKLNDAVEIDNATSTEDRLDNANSYGEDDDLELQQSGGSLDDLRKSNGTRLRELAQVFTHALSAYLLDPDTFKKVLTEIRPTEPSRTTLETDLWATTTTPYPAQQEDEDDDSLGGEKDEVLDFSDDSNDIRQKLTTTYPTTFELPSTTAVQENIYEALSTLPSTYYTTPRTSGQDFFEYSTNLVSLNPVSSNYFESSMPPTESTEFTAETNSTPYTSGSYYNRNNEIEKESVESTEGRLPSSDENQNRVGGFQNNSVTTTATEPYTDKISFLTTPVSDNYVVSPTPLPPSMFVHMVTYNWNKKSTSKKPEQQLSPPLFDARSQAIRKGNDKIAASLRPENYPSTQTSAHNVRATTLGSTKNYETSTEQPFKIPREKSLLTEAKVGISLPTSRNSYTKFRNLYNRVDEHNIETTERATPATTLLTEFPVTTTVSSVETTTSYANDSNDPFESTSRKKEEPKVLDNDHWTSSPAVTHLWETSVFVDPQRINYDLESDLESTVTTGTQFTVTDSRERIEYGNTPSFDDDMSIGSEESSSTDEDTSLSVQRSSRDEDSPTSFSLLPTSFTNTVTPKPLITTRSSITTTITSSVTSTKSLAGQQGLVTLLPYTAATSKSNGTENEIAEKLFGKLNASSTDTLMRVMKQADNNETVRQLVLLLIRHCNDPATNNTLQREKEELLNALLRLPVNEFSSEESKNVVAEINQLNLPAVKSVNYARSGSTAPPLITEPPVTTFRSRKSRKFRSTTENSANIARRSEKVSDENNSLQEDESFASDNRALELLRSLYTIATKWG